MMTAVMPRRSRETDAMSVSTSGVEESASTAARSCMIFWCWRPPRSAGRNAVRPALTVIPTARFSDQALSAIDAAARIAASVVDSSPRPAWTLRWRSRMIHASAVCSRSNSLTWISPWRAVERQWIRFMLSPGAYGRTVVASGVVWSVRSGEAWLPSRLAAGRRHIGSASRRGYTMTLTPCPTVAEASKKPNGSPVRMCSGSIRKWPRRASGTRISHDRSVLPLRVMARPGRPPGSVVGLCALQPRLGQPAGVAQRVGHAHLVADVAAAAG